MRVAVGFDPRWRVLLALHAFGVCVVACAAEPLPPRSQFLDQKPDAATDAFPAPADAASDGAGLADLTEPADLAPDGNGETEVDLPPDPSDAQAADADDAVADGDAGPFLDAATDADSDTAPGVDGFDSMEEIDTGPDTGACPPGAQELCNGQDDDCDGLTDNGLCDDEAVCTEDKCDGKTGVCGHLPIAGACSDGNACTIGDQCQLGECTAGKVAACDDGNACTLDTCVPVTTGKPDGIKSGCTVVSLPGKATCTDGNACTSGDGCQSGSCAPGTATVCDDGKPCTGDGCDPNSGCTAAPWVGLVPCTDGNACTSGDVCKSGACAPGTAAVCNDGNACTTDGCAPNTGCTVTAVAGGTVCSDGNACTNGDACLKAACVPGPALACAADSNPCTSDSCDAKLGCQHPAMANGTACGSGACTGGFCSPGVDPSNPAAACKAVQAGLATAKDGSYWLDPDGPAGAAVPAPAMCAFGLDGGGWTLVAVVSDDGQNTWTWANRLYWSTDTTLFGNLAALTKDYKSPLMHGLVMKDLLFVHAPSGAWAAYHGVGNGSQSLAKKIETIGGPVCWQPGQGWPMSAGTIAAAAKLCSTHLFFNADDHDGAAACGDDDQAWGPVWSANTNTGCPFDDPGSASSLGPNFFGSTVEFNAIGFGQALGLNTGVLGTGQNRMAVYVR